MARENQVVIKVVTPGGLVLNLGSENIDSNVVRMDIGEGQDERAAREIARLTGCDVTIERRVFTRAKA